MCRSEDWLFVSLGSLHIYSSTDNQKHAHTTLPGIDLVTLHLIDRLTLRTNGSARPKMRFADLSTLLASWIVTLNKDQPCLMNCDGSKALLRPQLFCPPLRLCWKSRRHHACIFIRIRALEVSV
eukprot:scaffold17676_cov73-Cylindrotheca_fusiformis.AAC.2